MKPFSPNTVLWGFHAGRGCHSLEAYIFNRPSGEGIAFVRTPNFSRTPLGNGVEWKYCLVLSQVAATLLIQLTRVGDRQSRHPTSSSRGL